MFIWAYLIFTLCLVQTMSSPLCRICLKGICIMSDMRERLGCQHHARLKQTPLPTLHTARVPADQRQAHSTRHQPVWAQNSWHSHSPSHLSSSLPVCSLLPRHMYHIRLVQAYLHKHAQSWINVPLASTPLKREEHHRKQSEVFIHLSMIKASQILLRSSRSRWQKTQCSREMCWWMKSNISTHSSNVLILIYCLINRAWCAAWYMFPKKAI